VDDSQVDAPEHAEDDTVQMRPEEDVPMEGTSGNGDTESMLVDPSS